MTEPGTLRTLATWGSLLFGGMAVGWLLAGYLAPESDWAQAIGFMTLPLCFGIAMKSWYGAASATLFSRLLNAVFKALRGKDFKQSVMENMEAFRGRMPGTYVFVPVCLVISAIAGFLMALSPTAIGFFEVFGAMTLTGLAFGLLLRWLARTGRLPLPDQA